MAEAPKDAEGRLVLDKPRWEQNTFEGRAKHFLNVTDPRNVFATEEQLEQAKKLVKEYRLELLYYFLKMQFKELLHLFIIKQFWHQF